MGYGDVVKKVLKKCYKAATKKTGPENKSLVDKAGDFINVLFQTDGNDNSIDEYRFAKKMVRSKYPNANVKKQIMVKGAGKELEVFCNGKKVYNDKQDGDIRINPSKFMERVEKEAKK